MYRVISGIRYLFNLIKFNHKNIHLEDSEGDGSKNRKSHGVSSTASNYNI